MTVENHDSFYASDPFAAQPTPTLGGMADPFASPRLGQHAGSVDSHYSEQPSQYSQYSQAERQGDGFKGGWAM